MGNQVKIVYRNILENSTIAVTTENTSFPKYRLCDRDIGKLFKGTAFANPFSIMVNQGATLIYEVNRLLIPVGHNFNGLALALYYSTNAVDWYLSVSWTQADALLIDKTFTAQTKQYWQLNIYAPATIVELPEMFLGKSYTFLMNPLLGARQGRRRNVQSDETRSGIDRDVKFGELRRFRNYELKDMDQSQETELEAMETLCEGVKPIWLEDHLGNVFFAKILSEEDAGYDMDDPLYSRTMQFREVLGRTT